ncbi:MAG: ATP-binding cassette domain-containing protein [Acholeplasmataceae bacterium]|nr:ATP-binding cassette domain-containing protein [Acholeplasmataceae bacterium]
MSILEVENIKFSYSGEQLYQQASMRLFEGEHAVLVGPNGTGKSTLLKLLDKSLKPDAGTINWMTNKKIGYLDQYAKIDPKLLVKSYLYDVFLPLFEKEKEMEKLYQSVATAPEDMHEKIMHWASDLQEQLLDSEFYKMKSLVGNIIHGLGLQMDILDMQIKHLSGGMRAKIILGKLLLENADVLLLDEPTNFLDVKHIEWLTKFLNSYDKAFIVVSHHEEFLMDIAQTVFALENGQISRYKGDYLFYLSERELRVAQQEKAFVSQQKFIKKTEDFIKKNIVRATTTKRAQSRRKMLAKIERIKAPDQSKTYHFNFPLSKMTGKDVFTSIDLEIGYSDSLLEPLNMAILKQEKVALTGKNGVGKSTFVKTILDIIPKLGGEYHWIDTAHIAYFEQESKFDDGITPFQVVHHRYQHFTKKDVMSLLANQGIDYEMATRDINTLSGGEQTKVRLALLRHQKGNVLILDEPTNHLDFAAKEALKDALITYEGTLILVSHEKEFYQDICDYEISLYEPEE